MNEIFNIIKKKHGEKIANTLCYIQEEYGNQIPNDIVVYKLGTNNLMKELERDGLARKVGDGIPQQFYKIDNDCRILNG